MDSHFHWFKISRILSAMALALCFFQTSATAESEPVSAEESPPDWWSVQPDRPAWFPGKQWYAGVAVLYASGDFGTDLTTRAFQSAFWFGRTFRKGSISLGVPYVNITTSGTVRLLGETPEQVGPAFPARIREDGLGDISLVGRYQWMQEKKGGLLPSATVVGRVKFPTGDEERGLSTGEFDEEIGLEFSKDLSHNFSGYFDIGYTFVGDPSGINLRNDQWKFSPGLGYRFTDRFVGLLYYEESRALVSGADNPRSLQPSVVYRLTPHTFILVSGLIGLSDGAPDYGAGSAVLVRF